MSHHMASSPQGIPTYSHRSPIAKSFRHLQGHEAQDDLPSSQAEVEETKHITADASVTPRQRVRGFACNRNLHDQGIGIPQSGAVASGAARPCTSSPSTILKQLRLEPFSPSRQANIRVRRAQRDSTLLHSPARAGYAARMRDIFEDAGREYVATHDDEVRLYSQLPNVSRKASPPFHNRLSQQHSTCSSPNRRPESLCLPTNLAKGVPRPVQLQRNLSWCSEPASESWSGDSGYFVADPRGRASSMAPSSADRIYDWLQNISRSETDTIDDASANECDDDSGIRYPRQGLFETQGTQLAVANKLSPRLIDRCAQKGHEGRQLLAYDEIQENNPFVYDDYNSELSSLLKLGKSPKHSSISSLDHPQQKHVFNLFKQPDFGSLRKSPCNAQRVNSTSNKTPYTPTLQTEHHNTAAGSPPGTQKLEHDTIDHFWLSPNVCVERGPARYHANRMSPYIDTTPSSYKERVQVGPQLKENVSLMEEMTLVCGRPLVLHSKRLGTDF